MHRPTSLVAALLLLAAASGCGGTDTPTGLNPAFAGTWSGTSTLALATGEVVRTESSTVGITVSGQIGSLNPVCFDGTGTIQASGTGNSAAWTGSLACPAVAFPGCASTVLTWTSATAVLGATGTSVTATTTGKGTGCGLPAVDFVLTFRGTK